MGLRSVGADLTVQQIHGSYIMPQTFNTRLDPSLGCAVGRFTCFPHGSKTVFRPLIDQPVIALSASLARRALRLTSLSKKHTY